ncbi:hypothetical protein [Microbulbifer sp. HZ11]|uniref:hypothetical protein n=1 Tax=Microbulbifer sp. HZ11 TaxID=1453501 RepID=UPI0005B8F750|nr:hypothetical protein [Microbulbifer sp. HZ11]
MKFELLESRFAHCRIHGGQKFIPLSADFVKKLNFDEPIYKQDLAVLEVLNRGNKFQYLVSKACLEKFGVSAQREKVTLVDRDKQKQCLNDRLVIQKLMKEIQWVCPICFRGKLLCDEIIEVGR